MRCPECRRQYSRFAAAPDRFRPTAELDCPHCGVELQVGWWPIAGMVVLTVATAATVAATFWFGIGEWFIRELEVQRRVLRTLVRAAVAIATLVAVFGPGIYALWGGFGWYARRPTRVERSDSRYAGNGPGRRRN